MYREPHLQKKSDECRDLWWVWKKFWDIDAFSDETKEARKMWSDSVDEFGEMIREEVKTNPRYHGIRM
tara:strand:+ start:1851 stop:2054 length:204 start_codon:yes stop_codon:yes gene_type:complete